MVSVITRLKKCTALTKISHTLKLYAQKTLKKLQYVNKYF